MTRKTVSFKPVVLPGRSDKFPEAVDATAEEWIEAAPVPETASELRFGTSGPRPRALRVPELEPRAAVGAEDFAQACASAGWRMMGKHLADFGDLLACRTPLDVCQWQGRIVRDSVQTQLGLASNLARLFARVFEEAEATLAARRAPEIGGFR